MAGALSLVTGESFQKHLCTIKNQWEVEYARFFNFPPPSFTSPNLRPLPKSKLRCGGTWFPSSSTSTLQLVTDVLNPETILIVALQEKTVEEHFTCNLQFTWPQVSCVIDCPTRGSRVVFASYRDWDGQMLKFALRFATCIDAETFICALKDSLKDSMGMGFPRNDFGSEISSHSEFASSNGLQCRDEELSFMDPITTCSPQMTSMMNYSGMQNQYSQDSFLGHSFERVREAELPPRVREAELPPSFTALLTNCCAEVEQEQVYKSEEKVDLKSQIIVIPEEEIDLKSQLMRYMSDSSFHDMLAKVEEVITELGGDLAL